MRRKEFTRRLVVPLLIALAVMLTGVPRAVQAISISFSTVVDMATAIPDGSGNFTGFIPPDPIVPLGPAISEAGNVAFAGYGADGQVGIYLIPEGPPTKVADLNTAIPSGTGMFTAFAASPNISGTEVAFVGYRHRRAAGRLPRNTRGPARQGRRHSHAHNGSVLSTNQTS